MNISSIVNSVRARLNIGGGEEPVATVCRALIGRDGIVIDADKLAQGDTSHLTEVQDLLGITSAGVSSLGEIGVDQEVTVGSGSQTVIFGAFTVYGTLTVYGEMRFGPLPF